MKSCSAIPTELSLWPFTKKNKHEAIMFVCGLNLAWVQRILSACMDVDKLTCVWVVVVSRIGNC